VRRAPAPGRKEPEPGALLIGVPQPATLRIALVTMGNEDLVQH
jgi:hypothetical protein